MKLPAKDIIEFTLLFNRNKTKVYNYVLKMTSDKMLSEDIVQNVFLKLYENFNSLRNKDATKYWIFTTARNEVYSLIRSKKAHVDQFNVLDSDEIEIKQEFNLENEYELKETKTLIMGELNIMPAEQKDVFLLKEYGGFSYKEISTLMNIDEGRVKSRLFKVRQKLINKISRLVK